MRCVLFALSVLILCSSGPALAGIPCIIIDVDTAGTPAVALITPSGTGASLADQGITISVQIMDCALVPVPNYPRQDVWVWGWNDDQVWMCPGGSVADRDTDADGRTTISGAIAGGGTTTDGTVIYVSGYPMTSPTTALPLDFVSPDLDGDLDVDIADFALFGQDFGSTAMRSDLDPNGVVDIGDFSIFGRHFGTNCP